MDRFTISKVLLEEVASYLVTKPYKEVAGLITAINKDIKPVEQAANKEEPKE